MAQCMEFEGKNLKKALQKACEYLKTEKSKLKYDVISFGSSGIFGLVGIRKARIRVQLNDLPIDTGKSEEEPPSRIETTDTEGVESQKPKAVDETNQSEDEPSSDIEKNDNAGQCTRFKDIEDAEAAKQIEALGQDGIKLLQQIVDSITDDAQIGCQYSKSHIKYDVSGGNSAVLIGKKGQTLEAIQYLVEKAINKRSPARIRVMVDIEGYMANRKKQLRKMALSTAQKVKASGKPSSVGQMNSHDRRIVHMALKNDSKVRTQSIGDGYLRKLVIFPKKAGNRMVIRLNSLNSFTRDFERAWEFGTRILEARVPIPKVFFDGAFLHAGILQGEEEVLVIGGEYDVLVRWY